MVPMDRVEEIRGFTAVADARSFSQAARRLGISAAQISKLVASLEDRLGVRLLNRTTRDVSLTDTGRSYLARARELLEAFDQLESSVDDSAGPRGLLRISVPVSFGAVEIGPALLDFAATHEEVGLDVSFSDRAVNLVEEGFDAAVRIGNLSDSSLVARRLAATRIVTCASPAYLARHGTPLAPDDLVGREFIIDLNVRDPFMREFGRGARRRTVRVDGRLRFSSAQACLAAARAGFGIARAPAFAAADDLRAGRLWLLLAEFEPEPVPIHVVYPQTRHLAAKVRAFIDFLAQRFAGEPEWHLGWK
jgi:DNA-binding transcriptional LysR family regulator